MRLSTYKGVCVGEGGGGGGGERDRGKRCRMQTGLHGSTAAITGNTLFSIKKLKTALNLCTHPPWLSDTPHTYLSLV